MLKDTLLAMLSGIGLLFQFIYEIFVPRKFKSVKGQTVLITGGANGIGRQMGLNFAKHGANVAVVDVDLENAQKTAKDIRALGVKAEAFKTDISKLEEVEQLKENVEAKLGPVDILLNNAGIFLTRSITEEKPENLLRMLNINMISHFWTVRCFLPGMIERKRGHIVATSSTAGLVGIPAAVTYSTSKFGVRGFMEALTLDMVHHSHDEYIKTSTIFPYFMNTNVDVKDSVIHGCEHKVLYSPEVFAKKMVEGILRNEEIIALPRHFYYLSYLTNMPLGLKKRVSAKLAVRGFKGVTPRNLK